MTSATDNRTTELLRKLLDKRGVEYDESTQGNTTFFRFDYRDSCGDYLHTIAITGACISAYSDYFTPEQAIAATLEIDTCSMEYGGDVTDSTKRMLGVYFCSECGSPTYNDCMPYYCMYCGKAVKR